MSDKPSALERAQAAFRQLSAVATGLNAASDELGKTIIELDAALKQLNLGISAWVVFSENHDEDGSYWSRSLGYTKIGNEWGIALKTLRGRENWADDEVESWRFNDAPRWMRLDGVDKIPELLEHLIERADDTTKRIRKKNAQAKELASAIKSAAESKPTNELPDPPIPTSAAATLPLLPSPARK